jgi:hypothetical protein
MQLCFHANIDCVFVSDRALLLSFAAQMKLERDTPQILNCRRLPARLTRHETAHLLNLRDADSVSTLVAARLLKPLRRRIYCSASLTGCLSSGFTFGVLKGVSELIQFLVRHAESQACFTPLGDCALHPPQNLVRTLSRNPEIWQD